MKITQHYFLINFPQTVVPVRSCVYCCICRHLHDCKCLKRTSFTVTSRGTSSVHGNNLIVSEHTTACVAYECRMTLRGVTYSCVARTVTNSLVAALSLQLYLHARLRAWQESFLMKIILYLLFLWAAIYTGISR